MKRIKKIEIKGNPFADEKITRFNWLDLRRRLSDVDLPRWEQLKEMFGGINELRVQPGVIYYKVFFTNGEWIEFTFKRGFIWDGASDPVGPNDDIFALMHCRPHDACGSLNLLCLPTDDFNNEAFRDANKLMYRALRCKNVEVNGHKHKIRMPLGRALKYYWAVNTIAGRAIYEKDSPKRRPWHHKTVSFKASSPGCWR